MSTITFAQHIYANLTTAQSPTRRRGYQTLACTRSRLSQSNIRAIEARSQHYPTQGTKSKWQFYALPGRQVVVSYLTGVPDPDEFGRTGRYVAHSIVIEPRDWDVIGSTPFAFMVPSRFCQSMDQALAAGDLNTGEIAAGSLAIGRYDSERAQSVSKEWPIEELWKLTRLVCHPDGILERGHFVSFVGSASQIQDALEVALLFSPTPRAQCSFDTSSTGCNWSREMKFWAQGAATEREARVPFVVLADQKKVRLPNDWSPRETPHERWMKPLLESRKISTICAHQSSVQLMGSALLGQLENPGNANFIVETVKRDFANANEELVNERMAALLPKGIPEFLQGMINQRIGHSAQARLNWLLLNPSGEALAEVVFDVVGDWSEGPSSEVKRSLTPLIEKHAGLRFVFAVWAKDQRAAHSSLSAMNSDEYKRFVQKIGQRSYAKVEDFFCVRHLDLWWDLFGGRFRTLDLAEGIALVANYGSQEDCNRLPVITSKIPSSEHREALMDWLNERPFRKRVKTLIESLKDSLRAGSSNSPDKPRSWFAKHIRRS